MRRVVLLVVPLALAACTRPPQAAETTTTPPPRTTTTLSASDVYDAVSGSLAFVETGLATGSAVMIDPVTLVTNAHVVWPETSALVSFPDGTSGEAPVVGYDWMADLALIDVGGLDHLPPAATFALDPLTPGAPVYLVGYPADDPDSATPAITSGIVSRLRQWPDAGLTFVQSDALISGGQSGGALVDDHGRVVGISGLSVGEGFALALSMSDVLDRLPGMRSDQDRDGLGGRTVIDLAGPPTAEGLVGHALDESVLFFQGRDGEPIDLAVDASQPVNADLVGPDGYVEATTDEPDVHVELQADLVLDGPYFVVVYSDTGPVDDFRISGVDTRSWTDPDQDATLEVGRTIAANGDYPGDLDWYRIDLTAHQTVTIRASSVNIDPAIMIELLDPVDDSTFASDSDSGGGVLGFDAELTYTAPTSGTYALVVFDETRFGPGGYFLSVEG